MLFARRIAATLATLLPATLASPLARADDTVLIFDQAIKIVTQRPEAQGGMRVDSTRSEVLVILGDRSFKVHESEQIWVYDFERNRVLNVRRAERTYSDWSLFAYVAFNDLELSSRLGLGPEGTGEPPRGTSVLELETLFGMRSTKIRPGRREVLADSSRDSEVRVSTNGRIAVSATTSAHALPPAHAAMFERFLLYRAHLHPDARRAVVGLGKVPQVLFTRFQDHNDETAVLLRLKLVTSTEESNPATGCSRVDIPEPDLAPLEAGLRQSRSRCADTTRTRWAEASRRFEVTALAGGRYLDASLAGLERSMCDCRRPSSQAWPADVRARAQVDTAVKAYVSASRWSSGNGEEGFRKLQAIDRSGLEKGYVLDFISAKARYSMGDLGGGARLALQGLTQNPCAVEAWMDLSAAYLKGYQTVLAWICLDRARALAPPDCPLLAEGLKLEQSLRERHPEFFN